MTTASGAPTPQLRLIPRGREMIIQQHVYVTFNPGQSKESSRWVWMDIPILPEEPAEDVKARLEVEALGKSFYVTNYQLVR